MTSPKLKNILAILHQKLTEREIAHALIGAMGLISLIWKRCLRPLLPALLMIGSNPLTWSN
jgi:hypothetical protein